MLNALQALHALQLFLVASALQSATPPPDDEAGWQSFDGVAVQINDDIVSFRELARGLSLYRRDHPMNTDAERNRAKVEILTRSTRERLAAQAGEDLGFDPKLIDARVKENVDRLIERHNGVAGMAKFLEAQEITTRETRDIVRDKLYADLWELTLTGEGAGPGLRPEYDRWVRPGAIAFHFRNAVTDGRGLEELGGHVQRVILQTMFLAPDAVRGPEGTAELAEDLRRRILAGDDMGELVVQHSIAPKDRGLSDPIDERNLSRVDARIAEFVSKAKPGDLSPVDTIMREGKQYWRLVKLVERRPEARPEFESFAVQKKITDRVRRTLDDRRLDRGYREMFDASYIWPAEFKQR